MSGTSPFVFNDIIYQKFEGMSIEHYLYLLRYDIYMHYFEKIYFCVHIFPYFFRYVEDTFVLVRIHANFSNLLLILLTDVISSLSKLKIITLFLLLMSCFLNTRAGLSTTVFKEYLAVSVCPYVFCIILLIIKNLLLAFYTYVNHALLIFSDPVISILDLIA